MGIGSNIVKRIVRLYETSVPTGEIARMVGVAEAIVVKVIAKYDPSWAERKGY